MWIAIWKLSARDALSANRAIAINLPQGWRRTCKDGLRIGRSLRVRPAGGAILGAGSATIAGWLLYWLPSVSLARPRLPGTLDRKGFKGLREKPSSRSAAWLYCLSLISTAWFPIWLLRMQLPPRCENNLMPSARLAL